MPHRRGPGFLIYYRDDGDLRAEISLPQGSKEGRFNGWRIRVILPVMDYKMTMRRHWMREKTLSSSRVFPGVPPSLRFEAALGC